VFIAYFPKVDLCNLHPVCVSVYHSYQLSNAYVKHGNWAHFNGVLHQFLQSVYVSVCVSLLSLLSKGSVMCIPPFVARKRLGKHFPAAKNTCNNKIIVGCHFLYGLCLIKGESMGLSVYPPIFTGQKLGKDVPTVMKNCWRLRFLCGPCHI
jgi:hypothetical protein